jgi:hypothetical protein
MDARIYRFNNLEPVFYPYLEELLNRVPSDIKERVLNDTGLEILGKSEYLFAAGWHKSFLKPVTNIIFLQPALTETSQSTVVHAIAHEIAHYVVGAGETGLREKEAEELVVEWGLGEESKLVSYNRPILEKIGHKVGCKWAEHQKEWKIDILEGYYEEWINGERAGTRYDEVWDEIDPGSVMVEMQELINKEFSDLKQEIEYDGSFDKGIVAGAMDYVYKERIKKTEFQAGLKDTEHNDLIDLLERISNDLDRLYSLPSFTMEHFLLASKLGIPSLSEGIDTLLERVKSDAEKG